MIPRFSFLCVFCLCGVWLCAVLFGLVAVGRFACVRACSAVRVVCLLLCGALVSLGFGAVCVASCFGVVASLLGVCFVLLAVCLLLLSFLFCSWLAVSGSLLVLFPSLLSCSFFWLPGSPLALLFLLVLLSPLLPPPLFRLSCCLSWFLWLFWLSSWLSLLSWLFLFVFCKKKNKKSNKNVLSFKLLTIGILEGVLPTISRCMAFHLLRPP